MRIGRIKCSESTWYKILFVKINWCCYSRGGGKVNWSRICIDTACFSCVNTKYFNEKIHINQKSLFFLCTYCILVLNKYFKIKKNMFLFINSIFLKNSMYFFRDWMLHLSIDKNVFCPAKKFTLLKFCLKSTAF